MPRSRTAMRRVREILRLKWELGLSVRQIAHSSGLSHPTVLRYIERARACGLSWPLPAELDDAELERRLFPPPPPPSEARAQPDWVVVHREMKRKDMTLLLLWDEYKSAHPNGYQYTTFCRHYKVWRNRLDVVMRQDHRAGEKLFVDYAGQTASVIDRRTGEVRPAQVFVAVMGASNYTYAEATWSQAMEDWIGSHVRTFEYFGAVPEIVVPDNLKSGVNKAHRYEPRLNRTYRELGEHYGVAILPARPAKPRDKAKAETGVQVVERWILARLRHRRGVLPDRTQRGHWRVARAAQRAALQEVARLPTRAVRVAGPSGDAAVAAAALRVRRMENGARAHGLSRGDRPALLLGSLPVGETTA